MSDQITVNVAERGDVRIVSLAGAVDLGSVETCKARILGAARGPARGVVVDLRRVTFLDSSGLKLIFSLRRRLSRRGKQFALVAPEHREVRRLLNLVDVEAAVELRESIEDAVRYCREARQA